jgi:hypothetical protein
VLAWLADMWVTLGRVQFRLGKNGEAAKYLTAGWGLGLNPAAADLLGQVYAKMENKQEAVHFYALAVAGGAPAATKQKLIVLLGDNSKADEAVKSAVEELSRMQTIVLPRLAKGPARAEFLVLLTPAASANVKFVSGSEDLRDAAKALASAQLDFAFPSARPVQLVRRGTLDCPEASATCQFVFSPADSVNPVN